MKTLTKILTTAFIVLILPLCVACNDSATGNQDKPPVKESYSITFNLNWEDEGKLSNPTKAENTFVDGETHDNFYIVNYDGDAVLYMTSSKDILQKQEKGTEINFTLYVSVFAEITEIKWGEEAIEFSSEEGDYKTYDFKVTISSDTSLYINGLFSIM